MLKLINQYVYPIAGIFLILCFSYVGYRGYNYGYSSAETKYVKQIAEINFKSAELLKQQIEDHNRFVEKQNKALKSLELENDKLDKIIKENSREAPKDPNAKRPALGKSSVMRLNRI